MDAALDTGAVLYGESDLRLRSVAPSGAMPSLVSDLCAAPDAAARELLVRQALRRSGFEWLAYGTVAQHDARSVPTSFLTSYAHPQWTRHYFAEAYHEVDPRHLEAPRSSLPLVWDLQDIDTSREAAHATGRTRQFMEDFRESGIRSGVFFHLPSPAGLHERTVISLLSSVPDRAWIVDLVLGQALTLGLCVHEFMSRHVERVVSLAPSASQRPSASIRTGLSALQQEILHCLSRGESDKEIAYRLQLSSHTVDYHMRHLRWRFSVRNRVQLVNAAC